MLELNGMLKVLDLQTLSSVEVNGGDWSTWSGGCNSVTKNEWSTWSGSCVKDQQAN